MKIYVLVENTTHKEDMLTEHGLSMYIETAEHKILFDTGCGTAFAENAERMGVDLSAVDICIISHGHSDHGGGLAKFMELNENAPIYISKLGFERYFAADGREIGLDKELMKSGRFILTDAGVKIDGELELLSCNELERSHKFGSFGLFKQVESELIADDFLHEQYLLVKENGKLILFSGCSHKGVLNLVTWLHPDILIGGFHFMKLATEGEDKAVLDEAVEFLNKQPVKYYTCHCTGIEQYEYLKERMPKLEYAASGDIIEL